MTAWVITALTLGWNEPLSALDDTPVTLRGFGTLGVAHNRDDGAGFIRDITQRRGVRDGFSGHTDSRLGLQLDVNLSPKLDATLQGVSRYRYDGKYTPELSWGFVKYAPTPNWDLRVGRLGWDIFMLADSRDVGYSYLMVRPPVEYFGTLQFSKLNGADLAGSVPLGEGILSGKLFAGRAAGKLAVDENSYADANNTELIGGHVAYEWGHWHLRAGFNHFDIDLAYGGDIRRELRQLEAIAPLLGELGDFLTSGSRGTGEMWSLGTLYNRGPLQGQLLFAFTRSGLDAVPNWTSGFASLGYRLGPWTPFAAFSMIDSASPPRIPDPPPGIPLPPELLAALEDVAGQSTPQQSTLSLGARYDFLPNMALKLQYDHVNVRRGGRKATQWRGAQSDWDGRARVLSATLDFIF